MDAAWDNFMVMDVVIWVLFCGWCGAVRVLEDVGYIGIRFGLKIGRD